MASLLSSGDPWKVKIRLYTVEERMVPYIAARSAFQLMTAVTLFSLFGLTCFVRFGIPCVARRGRFQGDVQHFKALCFALITYAISSTLEGIQYSFYSADTTITLSYVWLIIIEYLFRFLGYCSTFHILYRITDWLLERIHKESKLPRFVKIGHMVFFGLICCYTAFDWAWSIYFRVEYALSTDVHVINDSSEDSVYILGANQVLWWVASMEICAWLGYTAHYLYRSQLRAARTAGFFAFFASFFFFALCFMFAVVAIRYYFVLDDDATSWSWHSQLAVAILELLFTTTVYLGLLLTCMKLAVLGDDLDDKAYAPATWTEEENRPRSPIMSRPVSPIEEPAYIPKTRSEDKSNFDATDKDKKLLPTEMDGSKPFIEMDGTSNQLVEMEGSAQLAIEADSGIYVFKKPA